MTGKIFLAVFAVALLIESSRAATYTVGGGLGWTTPPSTDTYPNWAAPINFLVGDILVFTFATGAHDVATVTKQSYDTCNTNSPITFQTVGPVNFTLTDAGEVNFICTFGSHCSMFGQKFSINVTSSPAASPPPSPTPTTPAPVSPSSPPPSATPIAPAPMSPSSPPPSATPIAPAPMSPSSPPPAQTPGVPTGSQSPSPSTNPSTTPPPPATAAPPPTTTTPTPPNDVTPPPPPPPPPSSATTRSLTVMVTLLAIAMGFTL